MLEIWTISWPLMLGLVSNHLMLFFDRLFLAHYSLQALNAGANASLAYYIFLVVPIAICAISEILVGKLHGENSHHEIGRPVWQMIWLAIFLLPIFFAVAYFLPNVIFYGTGNMEQERSYFITLMCFAPFLCFTMALNGFFIGIGKVKWVALATILANVLNILFGYLLILGNSFVPPLGTLGAGLSMGMAQLFQTIFLGFLFFRRENRLTFGSSRWRFHAQYFKECLRIGAPAGLAHFFEVLAHFLFFRILIMAGGYHLSVVTLVQSFSMLVAFVIEAQSKGIAAIISNLLGAQKMDLVPSVLKSALKMHGIFFLIISSLMLLIPTSLISLFASVEEQSVFNDPTFLISIYHAIYWMLIFFLFDGFCWIFVGLLTASGDTRFLLYVSLAVHWTVYLIAAYFFIGDKQGAEVAWMIIACCSALNFVIFLWRYRSGKWLEKQIQSVRAYQIV